MNSISSVSKDLDSLNQLLIKFGIGGTILIIVLFILMWSILKRHITKTTEDIKKDNQLKVSKVDRKDDLRRDIYLELAVAINRTYLSVFNIFDLEIKTNQIFAGASAMSDVFARAQLILPAEILKALNLFNSTTSDLIVALVLKRLEIDRIKLSADLSFKSYNEDCDQRDSYLEMMKEHTISRDPDQIKYDLFQKWHTHFHESSEKNFAKYNKKQKELLNKQLSLAKNSFESIEKISENIPNLVFLLRKELEFKIDLDSYSSIFEEAQQNTQTTLKKSISELEKMIKDIESS